MFEPIDHKDSDLEYRQEVRDVIEKEYGPLQSMSSRDELVGKWIHSLFSEDDALYVLSEDGTVRCKFDNDANPNGKWSFETDRFTDWTWCEADPEFGLDEGTWNIESYHCMKTKNGRVVLWNGDGSLRMILTPL